MNLSNTSNGKIVVGVFRDRLEAEAALNELHEAGFPEEDTGYIIRGKRNPADDDSPVENDADLDKGSTGGGILAGGTIGGILGALAAGVIPGIGPVIAGGALVGILAGGVAGGVVGTLTGIGVPEEDAKFYEEEFKAGCPLITVRANGRSAEAWQIMQQHDAYDARTKPAS